jgi:hypothetical protein
MNGAGEKQQLFGERRFTCVRVGDDRERASLIHSLGEQLLGYRGHGRGEIDNLVGREGRAL